MKSNITFELFYKQAMIAIYQHTADTKYIADNTFPSKQREIKYINIAKKGFNYENLCVEQQQYPII